ncbi:MAG: hypothetical protein C4331_09610 [Meiothermus sp.]
MKNFGVIALTALVGLLAACGGGAGGGNSISGTINVPAGYTVNQVVVVACPFSADNCDQSNGKYTTLSGSGTSASYRIDGIGTGDYGVVAGSSSGLVGFYRDAQNNALPVKAGSTNINFSLVAAGAASTRQK